MRQILPICLCALLIVIVKCFDIHPKIRAVAHVGNFRNKLGKPNNGAHLQTSRGRAAQRRQQIVRCCGASSCWNPPSGKRSSSDFTYESTTVRIAQDVKYSTDSKYGMKSSEPENSEIEISNHSPTTGHQQNKISTLAEFSSSTIEKVSSSASTSVPSTLPSFPPTSLPSTVPSTAANSPSPNTTVSNPVPSSSLPNTASSTVPSSSLPNPAPSSVPSSSLPNTAPSTVPSSSLPNTAPSTVPSSSLPNTAPSTASSSSLFSTTFSMNSYQNAKDSTTSVAQKETSSSTQNMNSKDSSSSAPVKDFKSTSPGNSSRCPCPAGCFCGNATDSILGLNGSLTSSNVTGSWNMVCGVYVNSSESANQTAKMMADYNSGKVMNFTMITNYCCQSCLWMDNSTAKSGSRQRRAAPEKSCSVKMENATLLKENGTMRFTFDLGDRSGDCQEVQENNYTARVDRIVNCHSSLSMVVDSSSQQEACPTVATWENASQSLFVANYNISANKDCALQAVQDVHGQVAEYRCRQPPPTTACPVPCPTPCPPYKCYPDAARYDFSTGKVTLAAPGEWSSPSCGSIYLYVNIAMNLEMARAYCCSLNMRLLELDNTQQRNCFTSAWDLVKKPGSQWLNARADSRVISMNAWRWCSTGASLPLLDSLLPLTGLVINPSFNVLSLKVASVSGLPGALPPVLTFSNVSPLDSLRFTCVGPASIK